MDGWSAGRLGGVEWWKVWMDGVGWSWVEGWSGGRVGGVEWWNGVDGWSGVELGGRVELG